MADLSHCTVMVVDDALVNVELLAETLSDNYDIVVAMDGQKALSIIDNTPPDLLLLDIMMPGMDGYEVCAKLKRNPKTADIPVVFVTAMDEVEDETKGLELGAIDYLIKPISPPIVKARVRNHLELKLAKEKLEQQNEILEERVQERTEELALTQEVTIYCLADLAETRDPETGGHIKRTQSYVRALAEQICEHPKYEGILNERIIHLLYKSAPLHDIGKVGVPDSILLKPGKLTDDEFEEMKNYTIYGRTSLSGAEKKLGTNSFLRLAGEIAFSHHEKWDGSGYPQGLKGEEIPLSGRLMAIADVYDALISKRVYKQPFPHSKALSIIDEGRGSHFDPDLVDAFKEIENRFREIALEFADFDEERVALSQ